MYICRKIMYYSVQTNDTLIFVYINFTIRSSTRKLQIYKLYGKLLEEKVLNNKSGVTHSWSDGSTVYMYVHLHTPTTENTAKELLLNVHYYRRHMVTLPKSGENCSDEKITGKSHSRQT